MKLKKIRVLSIISIIGIFVIIAGFITARADTNNVTINVTDGTGIKDSLSIGSNNINKYLNPTILQGNSYMNVNVNGSYNFFKYQFINQSAKPLNIPTVGWQNLDLTLQQQVNNDDVVTTKQGNLNWRGYDVNHMLTLTDATNWSNPEMVFKNPSAATDYKAASLSSSWNTYGSMQNIVPYTIKDVNNNDVLVSKKWVSNSVFTSNLTAGDNQNATTYKEASKFWGYMNVPTDGTYYFGIRSDDGSDGSLTVDGVTTKFSNSFVPQISTWNSSGNGYALKATNADGSKRYYPIYLEYFNWGGAADFEMNYYKGSNSSKISSFKSNGSNGTQVPSTYFYPSKNVTPGEYSTTTFTGSSGVKFPANPGDYYIAYQTGIGSTVGSQGFYGPFTVEGKTNLSVSKTVIGGINKATANTPFTVEYTINPPPTIAATNNFKNIDGTYKSIISLSNIKLQDVFPDNISINTSGAGIAVNGKSMVMTMPDITYTYNGSVYVLNSTQTQVKKQVSLTASKSGYYTLSSLGSSVLTFLDVNIIPTNGQIEFPSIVVNVVPEAPVITQPYTGLITNNNKPVISGTSESNTSVDIYVDAAKIATVISSGTGNWTYTPTVAMSDGTHNITATSTSTVLLGNTSAISTPVNVTINTGKPALRFAMITSNNENTNYAKVGDVVTLRFSEQSGNLLGTTQVTIAGHTVTPVIGTGNIYTATYQMLNADNEGIVPFTIDFTNTLTSQGTQVRASTDGNNVTFIKTKPTLTPVSIKSNNSNPIYAKVRDNVILGFTSSTTLAGMPVTSIAGHSVTAVKGPVNSYTATYPMVSTDTEGIVPYTIDFKDLAGNVGTQVFEATDGTSVTFDRTVPTVKITYNTNPTGAGEDIITATYSEPVKEGEAPQISINQQGTIDNENQNMESGSDRRIWTFKYTVNAHDGGNYLDGVATVRLSTVHDAAGNIADEPTGTTFTIDTTGPTATINYSIPDALKQDVLATLNPNEPIVVTNNNGLSTYNFSENGTFTFEFKDEVGNTGTAIATVNSVDRTIIVKHGMFINGGFNAIKPEYAIINGFSGSFGIEFITLIKNSIIQMQIDRRFTISDLKLYKIIGEGQPIYVSNIAVPSEPGTFEITMPNVDDGITHFILAYKGTVNANVGDKLSNTIIVRNIRSSCIINVVKLPDLY